MDQSSISGKNERFNQRDVSIKRELMKEYGRDYSDSGVEEKKVLGTRNFLKPEPAYSENATEGVPSTDEDDELGFELLIDVLEQMRNGEEQNEPEIEPAKLSGVGQLVKELRGEMKPPQKERIVLDELGFRVREASKFPPCRIGEVKQTLTRDNTQDGVVLIPQHAPSDVRIVRKEIRKKMTRCKICKNRFIEKYMYEEHLREKHPALHEKYVEAQEEEAERQRLEDIEANRVEELRSGGFIPPENDVSQLYEVTSLIPLPGENGNDNFRKPRGRLYKKKVSPQCPFCDKRFKNELSLSRHLPKKHPEAYDLQQCLKCFKCLGTKAELATHKCELTYVCFECNPVRNMCTDKRLIFHRNKFHRGAGSGFKCSLCNAKFLTPRKLRKHKKMTHIFTTTFQCHFCTEVFVSEGHVTTHERVHTGRINFECKVCNFRANRYLAMEEHNREDHGYVCSICQKNCAERIEMTHHMYERHNCYLAADEPIGYVESPNIWMLFKGE